MTRSQGALAIKTPKDLTREPHSTVLAAIEYIMKKTKTGVTQRQLTMFFSNRRERILQLGKDIKMDELEVGRWRDDFNILINIPMKFRAVTELSPSRIYQILTKLIDFGLIRCRRRYRRRDTRFFINKKNNSWMIKQREHDSSRIQNNNDWAMTPLCGTEEIPNVPGGENMRGLVEVLGTLYGWPKPVDLNPAETKKFIELVTIITNHLKKKRKSPGHKMFPILLLISIDNPNAPSAQRLDPWAVEVMRNVYPPVVERVKATKDTIEETSIR